MRETNSKQPMANTLEYVPICVTGIEMQVETRRWSDLVAAVYRVTDKL